MSGNPNCSVCGGDGCGYCGCYSSPKSEGEEGVTHEQRMRDFASGKRRSEEAMNDYYKWKIVFWLVIFILLVWAGYIPAEVRLYYMEFIQEHNCTIRGECE